MPTYRHIPGVQVVAEFGCGGRYRYRLEITRCEASDTPRTVCVVMQNPSYANEKISDRSVTIMERVIFEMRNRYPEFNNIERMIVVNQFARVQTRNFSGCYRYTKRNNKAIESALQKSTIIVIAWGAYNRFKQRQQEIYTMLKRTKDKQFYKTSRHPSRIRYKGFIKNLSLPKNTQMSINGGMRRRS